ncbi:MAG: hypothetical protein L0241_24960 [Planctomycetia bacterium]|nr:hypothetical protein [Planctomycetia bacterium]
MRKLLLAAPVFAAVFAVGCFSTSGWMSATRAPITPTPTHTYWQKVSAILAQKPASTDLRTMMELVRTQTEALLELSPDGVDAELVAAVEELIKSEEGVIRMAEMIGYNSENLRNSRELSVLFSDANRKAADAKKKIKLLQKPLSARYGGGFAPIRG